jgi:ubiquinone/menaquinone biosynthesis C-methylase UbiE
MATLGSMHAYYSARAATMAKNFEDDPRGWVQEIITEVMAHARDRTVLEVACGTGNWTRLLAQCARNVTATDYSEGMLAVARSRQIPRTCFLQADAYDLSELGDERHDFGLAMWLVSHLALSRWHEFIVAFHAHLKPGAKVLLVDDIRRPDDGDPWYSKLATRDSYEIRRLPNGESYEIVKTYFTPEQLRALLQPYADNIQIRYERPCWRVTYEVRGVTA